MILSDNFLKERKKKKEKKKKKKRKYYLLLRKNLFNCRYDFFPYFNREYITNYFCFYIYYYLLFVFMFHNHIPIVFFFSLTYINKYMIRIL